MAIMCSTQFILSMTFERFYSIIRPHKAASFNTVKRVKITILFIVNFSISYNLPQLFISVNNGRTCITHVIGFEKFYGQFYYWLTLTLSFGLPFVSLLLMNSVIIHTLRQRSKLSLTRSEALSQREGSKAKNSERQIFVMLLFVTFAFLTLSTPAYAMIFYHNFYHGTMPYFYAQLHLLSTEWVDYVEEPMKYQALRSQFVSMGGWVVVGWVMGWWVVWWVVVGWDG